MTKILLTDQETFALHNLLFYAEQTESVKSMLAKVKKYGVNVIQAKHLPNGDNK